RGGSELLDDRAVIGQGALKITLPKLNVSQLEVGCRLVAGRGQSLQSPCKSFLTVRHFIQEPKTPAQIQLRFSQQRTLRELPDQGLKGAHPALEVIGRAQSICPNI